MPLGTLPLLVPLAAFLILAAATAVFVRRFARALAETREAYLFRRRVADLAGRIDTSLAGAIEQVDAVRRHELGAGAIGATIEAARDAVQRYVREAEALDGPAAVAGYRRAIVEALERAARALDVVEHGCGILAAGSRGGRALEGDTSIKRGYLNLVHAREAIARHAAEALRWRADIERRAPFRPLER
ncbi:MAG: hypothetical protein C4343_02960 [Chloroflexota bacterium]